MTFATELGGVATKLTTAKAAIERGAAYASEVGPLEMEILHPDTRASQIHALQTAGAGLHKAVTEFDAGASLVEESSADLAALARRYKKQGAELPMVMDTIKDSAGKVRAQSAMVRDGMSRGDTLAMWPQHGVLGSVVNSDISLALMMLDSLGAAPAAAEDAARSAAMVGRNVA